MSSPVSWPVNLSAQKAVRVNNASAGIAILRVFLKSDIVNSVKFKNPWALRIVFSWIYIDIDCGGGRGVAGFFRLSQGGKASRALARKGERKGNDRLNL
jgi:hypothetical protein